MTRPISNIISELIVLALISLLVNYIIYSVFTKTLQFPNFQQKGVLPMYIGGILMVCGFHLTFELTGVNEKWCKANF